MDSVYKTVQDSTSIVQVIGKGCGENLVENLKNSRLSTSELKDISFFRAYIVFKHGGPRYFYSKDYQASHKDYLTGSVERCRKTAIISLLSLIFERWPGMWSAFEIYDNKTGKRVAKGKNGRIFQLGPDGLPVYSSEKKEVCFYLDPMQPKKEFYLN